MNFISCFFIIAVLLGLGDTAQAQGSPVYQRLPVIIGDQLGLFSEILQEQRVLNIYVPAEYHPDSLDAFPVVYVLDGAMDEDFLHIAGLYQFMSFPWIETVKPSIVVGIANVDRRRDFTYPSAIAIDKEEFPTSGGSFAFMNFIEQELQPLIEKEYRCTTESTIIGQSLGGLFATEVLIKRPHLFDNYIIVSPSMWWDDGALLRKEMVKLQDTTSVNRVYVAVGAEGDIMEKGARDLSAKLLANSGNQLMDDFKYFGDQDHGNILHLAVYDALECLRLMKDDSSSEE